MVETTNRFEDMGPVLHFEDGTPILNLRSKVFTELKNDAEKLDAKIDYFVKAIKEDVVPEEPPSPTLERKGTGSCSFQDVYEEWLSLRRKVERVQKSLPEEVRELKAMDEFHDIISAFHSKIRMADPETLSRSAESERIVSFSKKVRIVKKDRKT